MRRFVRGQAGLTLIETMVALFIFSAVTLGVTPLLIGSIQGSAKARSYTVGKNVVVQAMERIRGLPYFESMKGVLNPTRQDVLDLYYPDMGAGYSAGTFTTICTETSETPAGSAPAACPAELVDGESALPKDYTLKFEAQFVRPDAEAGGQQTFSVVTPVNYNWATLATESPAAQLARVTLTASWPLAGTTRTFAMTTIVGERSTSPDKVRGSAILDFGVQSLTSYLGDDGKVSTLSAVAGQSRSTIETRSVSAADHETRAARLTLATEEFNGIPGSVLQDLFGATSLLHAPADTTVSSVSGPSNTISYQASPTSSSINIANAGTTSATNTLARVGTDLPAAEGTFGFTGADPIYWVDNQASTGSRAELLLHATRNILQIRKATLGMNGLTRAQTTALTPPTSRKVETTVNAKVGRLDLFPTTFINLEQRAVVVIRDFQLDLKCTSTANATSAGVTGTWSARLKYWLDTNPADNNDSGAYGIVRPDGTFNIGAEHVLSGSISGGTEQLEYVQALNPLVYDSSDITKDVYLFATPTRKGYLTDWSMNPEILAAEDAAGRTTTASLEGALQIITRPTNPAIAASALHVSLGKASCQAVDKR